MQVNISQGYDEVLNAISYNELQLITMSYNVLQLVRICFNVL